MITIATKWSGFVSVICSPFELPTLDLLKSGFFLGWSGYKLHVITICKYLELELELEL